MHRRHFHYANGFGWDGWWCPKCGYTHFYKWKEGFKDLTLFCDDYSERTLARHEQRLIEALDIRYRMARDLANWEI